jgi:biotin transport system substrate-specific component
MMMQNTLIARLGQSDQYLLMRKAILVLAGTAALALSAKIQIPFWPVPMTMQTLVVLLIGAHYGRGLAAATLLAYIAEGALGLPVFGTGAGIAYIVGPTGGYIFGFLVSAIFVGFAVERGFARRMTGALAVFIIGDAIILGLGCAWLSSFVGFEKALALGVLPFLQAEALKVALATVSQILGNRWNIRKKAAI